MTNGKTTATIALVETMPEWLRASHEAAGNSGYWPHNGSTRDWMPFDIAEGLVENDGDWTRIIRTVESTLTAVYDAEEGWTARNDAGIVWCPDPGALEDIGASQYPEAYVVALCERSPERGEWLT